MRPDAPRSRASGRAWPSRAGRSYAVQGGHLAPEACRPRHPGVSASSAIRSQGCRALRPRLRAARPGSDSPVQPVPGPPPSAAGTAPSPARRGGRTVPRKPASSSRPAARSRTAPARSGFGVGVDAHDQLAGRGAGAVAPRAGVSSSSTFLSPSWASAEGLRLSRAKSHQRPPDPVLQPLEQGWPAPV